MLRWIPSNRRYYLVGLVFILWLIQASLFAQKLVINEIMAANAGTIADEDGDYPDWLEIFNADTAMVNLNGFGLSDAAEPFKWVFPAVKLAPKSFLLVFASGKDRRDWLNWQTVIDWGATWHYRVGTSAPPANWHHPGFDASNWARGPSGFGYGDDDDATVIAPTISLYLRKSFSIADVTEIVTALLHVDYDDAFVAYLNGVEVARANIGAAGVTPTFNQSSDTYREALIYQGGLPEQFTIDNIQSLLQPGQNVLALQVHNYGIGSSDLTIIPLFTLGFKPATAEIAHEVPAIIRPFLPNLHTNFKIQAGGEKLTLHNSNGQLLDQVNSGYLASGFSRGRQPDGSPNWYIFSAPTPAATNTGAGFTDFAQAPAFSQPPGFYPGAISLTLAVNSPGTRIYYTLDGSEPVETSPLYSTPIPIQQTTTVRARTFAAGMLPGPIITHTYLINQNFTLPVISLTTAPANLWDYHTGIYVKGPNAASDFPHFGANFWQDWEKPVHVEFFEPDGRLGFSLAAGMKIYGGWSRGYDQKSLAIFARGQYGAPEIQYPIFPDKQINEFQAITLRNSGNDWPATFFRDGMMHSLVQQTHVDMLAYRPAVIFVNGAYWGLLNIREKANEHYIASHWQIDPDSIDLLENNAMVIKGDNSHYLALLNFINNHNLAIAANYEFVKTMIDIDNYLDYVIAQIYFDNTDWPGNNIKFWCPKIHTGRWRWLLFDTDFGFGLYNSYAYRSNTLAFATAANGPDWPNPPWSTLLLRKLLENDNFKIAFINRFADHLNVTFAAQRVNRMIDSIKTMLTPEMPRHQARWNGTPYNWDGNIRILKNFASQRVAYLRGHILQYFNLNKLVQITVTISRPGSGTIRINSQIIQNFPWNGHYFQNLPIQLAAIPAPGYQFVGWTGGEIPDNATITIDLTRDYDITAVFDRVEIAPGTIVINEIMYNAASAANTDDWIELYNASKVTMDLGGWIFKDATNSHNFVFGDGTMLNADDYIVLCRDTTAFKQIHPAATIYPGNFSFGLGRGDQVRLYDPVGNLMDSVAYDRTAPWPAEPDGTGPSLELKDPVFDNTVPQNWAASATPGGTPAEKNSIMTRLDNDPDIINQFVLNQNCPNPFTTSTTISYWLPENSFVTIKIYNILGKCVATMVNRYQEAGDHKIEWNLKSIAGIAEGQFASGVYFYAIEAGAKNQKCTVVKKMLLIK